MNNWQSAIKVSIFISFWATLVTAALGTCIGYHLAKKSTKYHHLKRLLETIVMLPMVLPPSIVGYILLIIIGKNGPLGQLFNLNIAFTIWAAILAAVVVSMPLMVQNAKSAFREINPIFTKISMTLGANPKQRFWKLHLPLAAPRLLSGIILSFARALGEFGATLMVAGNIPGRTQSIPLAIYFSVESGDLKTANLLTVVVLSISFIALWSINKLSKPHHEEVDHA